MSELSIRVRKQQDNGSSFRATPDNLYLGGVRSAKVDKLKFELPEEWTACAVTLHVQRLSGTLPDPQALDAENCVEVDRRWTLEKQGTWMLLAVGEGGYIAMTKPAQYTCYETIDTDSTTETIAPSVYEQFVNLVLKSVNEAKNAAKQTAEDRAAADQILTDTKKAGTDAVAAVNTAEIKALQDVETARTGTLTDIGNARSGAVRDVTDTKTAALTALEEQRAAALQEMKASVDAAAGSAEKAAASESNAKESETKSKASKEAAAKSEAAAKASKEAAAKSESASADSADKAKAEADRAAQITTNTFIYAYDLTLAPSGWTECSDEAATAAGLAYQYDAALADCTDRLEPSATVAMVSIPAAQKAGLGAVCESRAGAVRFWAAKMPEAEISLRLLLTNRTGEEAS
nr:MAG TPA: hypothetical protein [Caudoviricetes sp.]